MYAENTTVPVAKSRHEIETLLQKNGATQYITAVDWGESRAVVRFKMNNRIIRFDVPLPVAPAGRVTQLLKTRYDRQLRQRWRALLLVLKAKLEAIESDISSFDEEFMAHIVVPGTGDQTVADI